MKVSVSFIKSKYKEKETIDYINKTSADYIHVDLMDGIFVPSKNYDFKDIKSFLRNNTKHLDIHFMYASPKKDIELYSELKPEYITIHLEIDEDINELIDYIHSFNIKCGLSINPNTDVKELIPYLDKIDLVLIMSVTPGAGGQKFMDSAICKVNYLHSLNKDIIISVDGGINNETVKLIPNADMVVSGSYICLSDNYEEKISSLK